MKSKRAREAATAAEDVLPVDDAPIDKKRKRNEDESTNEVKQKKPKKDKKDKKKHVQETRKEKKDKRKDLQDLPDEDVDEDEAVEAAEVKQDKKDKEPKKEKKEKKKEKKSTDEVNGETKPKDEQAKKEKKDKKKKSKDKTPTDAEDAPPAATENGEAAEGDENETGKNSRYIVFVGNLPFTATAETIKAHFISLKPISVRCLKNKDDDKPCRGIAFVEFGNVWTMRTCLDKFHHTEFEGRKINVELTAGGGGKTKFRKDKIREKNKKLDENRSKRIEKEKTAKVEGGSGGGAQREQNVGGIHPSRLARNPGLSH